ncbi:hypothetical protein CKAH01_10253 [Colletotrichum kahawae]|uniref:Uncharacterized protein n=1 Tax=Colletotrichum kahawae TaxID=34407 RepID=A0AAD9XW74_COLKA|nr:hypothetical protein CKAH01_10253 [Colletotrichum kahawae]
MTSVNANGRNSINLVPISEILFSLLSMLPANRDMSLGRGFNGLRFFLRSRSDAEIALEQRKDFLRQTTERACSSSFLWPEAFP